MAMDTAEKTLTVEDVLAAVAGGNCTVDQVTAELGDRDTVKALLDRVFFEDQLVMTSSRQGWHYHPTIKARRAFPQLFTRRRHRCSTPIVKVYGTGGPDSNGDWIRWAGGLLDGHVEVLRDGRWEQR